MNIPDSSGWNGALNLLNAFEKGEGHLDELLDQTPNLQLRWLVMQVFRQWHTIGAVLQARLRRPPRPLALNLLRLGLAECMVRSREDRPKVVHHTVATARSQGLSKAECGFINGVLRTVLREGDLDRADPLLSHPEWLRTRWERTFGEEEAARLIEWNQAIPDLHVSAGEKPAYADASPWEGFYRVDRSRFAELLEDLKAGRVYVQDPFTRIPVGLLDPQPGESVLDLCAAPGGKSRLLAARMRGEGRLVLVDRPGPRLERLRENAARFGSTVPQIIGSKVEDLPARAPAHKLEKGGFDAVLIDVPCSNTGVIQKRPDVKIRLHPGDIPGLAQQQQELLAAAAEWVKPGGRLVYSTCSLEPEENDAVVKAFLARDRQFILARRVASLPWECRHDGGGAFLLTMAPGR